MYSRCDRFRVKTDEESSLIAPNTYVIKNDVVKGLWIPFNSTAPRLSYAKIHDEPSPASYYPKYRKHRITGGESIRYTADRICKVPLKKGSYPAKYNYTWKKTVKHQVKNKPFTHRLSKHPTLYPNVDSNILYILYEFKKNQPLPNYLKFPGEISGATLKYKGPCWSSKTGTRELPSIKSNNPGPARYSIGLPSQDQKDLKLFFQLRKEFQDEFKKSRQPVVPEKCIPKIEQAECKDSEINEVSYPYTYAIKSFNVKHHWSTGPRFKDIKNNEIVGPASYNPAGVLKCSSCVKNVGFTSTMPRFKDKKLDLQVGPGSYDLKDVATISGSLKKNNAKFYGYTCKPFSSSSKRFPNKPPPFSNIGPAKYSIPVPKRRDYFGMKKIEPITALADRFPSSKSQAHDLSYDVDASYKWLHSKQSHNKSEAPMFSKSTRPGIMLNAGELCHDSGYHAPYLGNEKFLNLPGPIPMATLKYSKKKTTCEEAPYYDIHPRYHSSFYSHTFNRSLMRKEQIPRNLKKNQVPILKCFLPKALLEYKLTEQDVTSI